MKPYCAQNNGDCKTCSLVSCGKDCQNSPTWGGRREGAGRKSTGRKLIRLYVTDQEHEQIKKLIEQLRKQLIRADLIGEDKK